MKVKEMKRSDETVTKGSDINDQTTMRDVQEKVAHDTGILLYSRVI